MKRIWEEHSILIVSSLISLALLIMFVVLQGKNSQILNLNTRWVVVAGVPILVALVAGGYIKKFKGFGVELESKLRTPVATLKLKATDAITGMHGDEKGSIERLMDFSHEQIERTKRLSFILGKSSYGQHAIIRYFRHLERLEYVEVKKESGEFVCLIPISTFKSHGTIVGEPVNEEFSSREVDRFIQSLERESVRGAYSDACIDLTVGKDESLIGVLKKMRGANKDLAVVVDPERCFLGIITSGDIEHRIADDVLYSRRA